MELETGYYYHIYNRSNNREIVYKEHSNYLLFLRKYREYLLDELPILAYCLMPTHFHMLAYVTGVDVSKIKKQIGILQSSYTKSINATYNRAGSLFQNHDKSKHIDDESYLITVATYIHQNPVRAGLARIFHQEIFFSATPKAFGTRAKMGTQSPRKRSGR